MAAIRTGRINTQANVNVEADEIVRLNSLGRRADEVPVVAFTGRYVETVGKAFDKNSAVTRAAEARNDHLGAFQAVGDPALAMLGQLLDRETEGRVAEFIRENYTAPFIQVQTDEMPTEFQTAHPIPIPPNATLYGINQIEELLNIYQPCELEMFTALALKFAIHPNNVEAIQTLLQQLPNLTSLAVGHIGGPFELNHPNLSSFTCKNILANITFRTPNLNYFSVAGIDRNARLILDCVIPPACTIVAPEGRYNPVTLYASKYKQVISTHHFIRQFFALRYQILKLLTMLGSAIGGVLAYGAATIYLFNNYTYYYTRIVASLYACTLATYFLTRQFPTSRVLKNLMTATGVPAILATIPPVFLYLDPNSLNSHQQSAYQHNTYTRFRRTHAH